MLDKFRTGEGKNFLKNINNKLTLLLTNTLSPTTKNNLFNISLIFKTLKTKIFTWKK
jgi:hypothetical protein